jgi:DNA-binding NarL/FixJ family response regulator
MSKNQTVKRAKILIVDDHPAVREALTIRSSRQRGLEVCGEASDTNEALRLAGRQENTHAQVEVLANRELEIFLLIGEGMKTADIAERLHLSVKTVETYRDRIRQKLELSDGTELAHYATQWVLEHG